MDWKRKGAYCIEVSLPESEITIRVDFRKGTTGNLADRSLVRDTIFKALTEKSGPEEALVETIHMMATDLAQSRGRDDNSRKWVRDRYLNPLRKAGLI